MSRNIEIKARLHDRAAIEAKTREKSKREPEEFQQEDVFFSPAKGRLKLRMINGRRGELIQYDREDAAGPTLSNYVVVPTDYPEKLRAALEKSCGVRAVVRKKRRLYWIGNTRVHFDQVEGLGDFIELEVVLGDQQSAADGQRIANELMSDLGIRAEDLIEGAYVDLLKEQVA